MDDLEVRFGAVLKRLRLERQLSQEQLAFDAELSRNYISQMELGQKSPSLRTIWRVCRVLAVQPSTMIKAVEE